MSTKRLKKSDWGEILAVQNSPTFPYISLQRAFIALRVGGEQSTSYNTHRVGAFLSVCMMYREKHGWHRNDAEHKLLSSAQ
jgi:hypothetical protein